MVIFFSLQQLYDYFKEKEKEEEEEERKNETNIQGGSFLLFVFKGNNF